jgi:hypothetical protein
MILARPAAGLEPGELDLAGDGNRAATAEEQFRRARHLLAERQFRAAREAIAQLSNGRSRGRLLSELVVAALETGPVDEMVIEDYRQALAAADVVALRALARLDRQVLLDIVEDFLNEP